MNKPTPLLLRSFGRSGSTMMMQLLGTHQNILFDRAYPFEIRFLSYFVKIARKAEASEILEGWDPEMLLNINFKNYGRFPYQSSTLVKPEQLPQTILHGLWKQFMQEAIGNVKDLEPDKPVYYAEKTVDHNAVYLNERLYCRNIILLRDPRDEFLSIKSFNKKRGYLAFGWQAEDTDETFAVKMCNQRRTFLKFFAGIEQDDRRFAIKYEDFLAEPASHSEKLSDWLGLKLNYRLVKENEAQFKHHMTSTSIETTRERWKTDLPKEVQDIFKKHLGKELEKLGYEV